MNLKDIIGEAADYDKKVILEVIRDASKDVIDSQNKRQDVGTNAGVNVGTNEEKVLALLRQDSKLTAKTLASALGLTDRRKESCQS